jgi:hypothetical protein
MRLAKTLKYFSVPTPVSASIHENVSRGYFQTDENGNKKFVPYTEEEFGEIHSFLNPMKNRFNHMKWTKTRDWKDKKKAEKSKWKYTKVGGGLNTISK